MSLKTILNKQTDFTGEFPAEYAASGLWRFNESTPDEDTALADSSGCWRDFAIVNWSGTTANLSKSPKGRQIRFNINNPTSEKTHLQMTNDGSIFANLGERIIVGGWMCPTTYSAGSLILDQSLTPSFKLVNGGWYFIAGVIEPNNKKFTYVVGDRSTGEVWKSETLTFTGELNRSCVADLIIGMHAATYYYAGGFDEWFLDCDSPLTADDLVDYFNATIFCNGADNSSDVDALTDASGVTLKATNGVYPESGILYTKAAECNMSGTGRVSYTSEYVAGTTAVASVETSTSDDLVDWSDWVSVGADGKLQSPNRNYIRFKVTLTTSDTSKTPKLIDIRLYDIPKAPYEKIGYARPVVLDDNEAWEAILENAYDIIVTGEINGEDTLTFSIPFRDGKRKYLENEKKIQIVDDVYKIRTITDVKDTTGNTVTQVYAEAEFYDLTFSVRKEEKKFDAETAEAAMSYALADTEWSVGTVNVTSKRTWTSTEKNALSILRSVANLHGGDFVFDCPNRLVHLLTVNGKDSGALFAYKKNMKSIERVVDTRSLVTRIYAVGANGMTFADINNGKAYLEDFTYSKEVRITTLDCSSFTNPYQMKEYTAMRLAEYCKPTVSYVLNAMDLSVLTGYEHEAWNLGDYVRVEDKDLGLSVTTRIVRREYNLQESWNTVLELSTTLKNLGSSVSSIDTIADALEGTGMVSNNDIRELVPFNHLRNSRADDGLAYWVSSGFEADGENGASGTASFKAEGVAGMTKSLYQTVYPSNRSSYTLSAQIASEDLKKMSDDAQVGIEVVIEYEDGSTETRFIDLY